MDNPITVTLPADLPTDWTYGQTVAPTGAEAGLAEQYGYNYLMEQVNAAQQALNEVGPAFENIDPSGIGAEPSGTASAAVSTHNADQSAHPYLLQTMVTATVQTSYN